MATQYIGARYVPIIYTNPDDGSANWKANVDYESLTIVVEDNGDSYTSKKAVPKSIGKPSENPLYWVKTGDFNASLLALQREVGEVETNIGEIEDVIGDGTLETEAHTIIGAINEIHGDVVEIDNTMGDEPLETEAQTVIGGINEINDEINNETDGIKKRVEDVEEEIPTLLKKEFITNNVVKYLYDGYAIFVVKVKDGIKPNVDVSSNTKHYITDRANELDSSICLNAGLFNTGTGIPQGVSIKDGEVVTDTVTDHQVVAFNADGDMKCYGGDVPANDIISDGYINALPVWGSIVKNGAVDTTSIADMPSSMADQTSQQNIANDSSGNYYIITTTYNCPLDMTDIANWIIANISGVANAVALDGGGSVATLVNGIQINAISDFTHSKGRRLNGIIYFKNENASESDKSLMGLSNTVNLLREFINPVALITNYDSAQDPDYDVTGARLYNFNAYQVGCFVFLHGIINVSSAYTNTGWQRITKTILPRIADDGSLYPMIRAVSNGSDIKTGRIDVVNQSTDQTQSNVAYLEMRVALSSPTENLGDFDFSIMYITSQDKTK